MKMFLFCIQTFKQNITIKKKNSSNLKLVKLILKISIVYKLYTYKMIIKHYCTLYENP